MTLLRRWMIGCGLAALCAGPMAVPAQEPGPPPPAGQRDSLEARVRARMTQMMRNQLGLNDEQVRRLQVANRRFEGQRRQLLERERQVRLELRAALAAGDSASQPRVGELLDRTLQLQRQRLELVEAEQKEFATFLTPVQRARLFGLQEQLQRRMTELREQGPPPGAPRRPGAPMPRAGRRPPPAR